MKENIEAELSTLRESPILAPLRPTLVRLKADKFPTLHDLNNLLEQVRQTIKVQLGHPLRFVPQVQGHMGFESQYEPRCYLTGEVQTRPENWHDLFNALVWLTFPKAKAAINARHYQVLHGTLETADSQRGKVKIGRAHV